jgi:hypothetical protein
MWLGIVVAGAVSSAVYFSTCVGSPVRGVVDCGNASSSSATERRVRGTGWQLMKHCRN